MTPLHPPVPLPLGNVARKGADLLGLVKMAPSGWRYYAEEVALGLEDYFTGRGEAPGRLHHQPRRKIIGCAVADGGEIGSTSAVKA